MSRRKSRFRKRRCSFRRVCVLQDGCGDMTLDFGRCRAPPAVSELLTDDTKNLIHREDLGGGPASRVTNQMTEDLYGPSSSKEGKSASPFRRATAGKDMSTRSFERGEPSAFVSRRRKRHRVDDRQAEMLACESETYAKKKVEELMITTAMQDEIIIEARLEMYKMADYNDALRTKLADAKQALEGARQIVNDQALEISSLTQERDRAEMLAEILTGYCQQNQKEIELLKKQARHYAASTNHGVSLDKNYPLRCWR